jgi:CRP/FNR family transcriptional regulator
MTAPDTLQVRQLLSLYPAVASVPAPERDRVLATQALALTVPAGTVLFDEGTPCRGFPMVLSGEVRVARGSAGGRSLELYRVAPGEMCVVSTSCLFAGVGSGNSAASVMAQGVAQRATEAVLVSPAGFESWCNEPGFRRYAFSIFGSRLADLMALVEAVAFQRLDHRLAAHLLRHGSPVLRTHQQLADELGTVREIVTRLLKRFEATGWVALGRERIDLIDPAALESLRSSSGA